MDTVSQALGLGFDRMDEEDSLQPNDGTGTGNVEILGRSTTTGADDDESWDRLVAEHRGTAMTVTQPQDQEQAPLGQ
jgi:hypothetical protein